ncbi:carboxysome shell carbonic anhydrase [Ectothiorhodospira magna]|uniref:Carboxysome shell carbonic anhydrase n=1 Tax=Ectothiorhodospira magna TaxID=867345 RepID=A0A1H9CBE3_9GAMM|nr:carboxysome shell carbonic anhydrase [Ectothiorhodospira magna]SEP98550.1 carboxysome shell carbonic anhydrase [Ectothiorhodospira magna]
MNPESEIIDHIPTHQVHHPLADLLAHRRLRAFEQVFESKLQALIPTLQDMQYQAMGPDHASRIQAMARERLGFELPVEVLERAWIGGLDVRLLYAHGIFRILALMVEGAWRDTPASVPDMESVLGDLLDCDVHAMVMSACPDGRLMGLKRLILRLPGLQVRPCARVGGLFDVDSQVDHWRFCELLRHLEGVPVPASVPSRYLKVCVYHFRSTEPEEACLELGGGLEMQVRLLLDRLRAFREAVGAGLSRLPPVETLLIGVDTDTDGIRLHVPDAAGRLDAGVFIDSRTLYRQTLSVEPRVASLRLYQTLHETVRGHGPASQPPREGLIRVMASVLQGNLCQLDYLRLYRDGRHAQGGRSERLVIVGDALDEVQLRNLAWCVGAGPMEVMGEALDLGVRGILNGEAARLGLPVPILVHRRYDAKVEGSREREAARCLDICRAIEDRYAALALKGGLVCQGVLRARDAGGTLEFLAPERELFRG